jgi:ABC-type uncharacterized transport system substrate-binding protein
LIFNGLNKYFSFVALNNRLYFSARWLLIVFLFACNNAYSNKSEHILFVLSKNTPEYRKMVYSVMANQGVHHKLSYDILIYKDQARIEKTLQKSAVVISIGSTAADTILARKLQQPVINTLITESVFNSLAEKYFGDSSKAIASGVNPLLLDQPFERRLNLAYGLVKNLDNVGVMLGSSAAQSISVYSEAIKRKRLNPKMIIIDPDKNPIKQLDPVIRSSDAFIPIADSHLINVTTAKWILHLAYRYRVPVIGYSSNYVEAGALASVYSSPQNVSQQTAELLKSLLTKTHKNQVHLPKYCTIKFNKTVAWHLNLEIPKALEKNTGRCEL